MKTFCKYTALILLLSFSFVVLAKNTPQAEQENIILIKGKVIDKVSAEVLVFATIAVNNSNVATVSNSEGYFKLKVPQELANESLNISYIGHESLEIPISSFKEGKNETISLAPIILNLEELSVFPDQALIIINNVLNNISENYPQEANLMTAFYRETIKKRRQYTALAEAVVDVYKPAYNDSRREQVLMLKGRKGINVSKMDTLLFKLQGGPHSMLSLDIAKYPYSILSPDVQDSYDYTFKNRTRIDGELHLVIAFKQRKEVKGPMFYGTLYIHAETMALASASFSLNTENRSEASNIFIRKKPMGCDVYPIYANYMVNYRRQGDTWYYSYARGEVAFKLDWKKRLFDTSYIISSEMAATDRRSTEKKPFKGQERLKSNSIMTETVGGFYDKNFWGEYNVIEPEKSINTAIKKIAKNMENMD